MHVYIYKLYVPTKCKAWHKFLIRVGTEEDVRGLPHTTGPAH